MNRRYLLRTRGKDQRRSTQAICAAMVVAPLLSPGLASAAAGLVDHQQRSHTYGDFDGDGLLDRAFGFPEAHGQRGSVVVVYGSGAIEEINRGIGGFMGTHDPGDHFGDSVAAGDIDGDGYEDLVVGVPGDDITTFGLGGPITVVRAGSIHVIYGDDDGLTTIGDQIIDRGSDGLDATAAAYDRFGESVAVGDFNCDTREDVAVGVPYDDAQSGRSNDGAIHVIYGTSSGLTSADDFYHQGTTNVSGAPETNDEFGASLAVGNFNGDQSNAGHACMDLAVGIVGENNDGGFLVFFYGNQFADFVFGNGQGLSQNTDWAFDDVEAFDAFGAQLWTFNDNNDAYDDLMVGVPGEVCDNGRVEGYHAFRGHSAGFVTSGDLNNTYDPLVCMDWDESEVQVAMDAYRSCMDFREPDCGQGLTSDFLAFDRGTDVERITACEAGLEFALDACEHWISDPICDVELCIAAAHELSSIALGCEHEGDVLTDDY